MLIISYYKRLRTLTTSDELHGAHILTFNMMPDGFLVSRVAIDQFACFQRGDGSNSAVIAAKLQAFSLSGYLFLVE